MNPFKHTRRGGGLGPNLNPTPNGPFTSGSWGAVNATETTGQTDPSGGTGASLIADTATSSSHYVKTNLTLVVGQKYRLSVALKPGTYTATPLVVDFFAGGQYAAVNWNTSTKAVVQDALDTMTLSNLSSTAIANGFWRVSFDFICNNGSVGEIDVSFNNFVSYAGTLQNFTLSDVQLRAVL